MYKKDAQVYCWQDVKSEYRYRLVSFQSRYHCSTGYHVAWSGCRDLREGWLCQASPSPTSSVVGSQQDQEMLRILEQGPQGQSRWRPAPAVGCRTPGDIRRPQRAGIAPPWGNEGPAGGNRFRKRRSGCLGPGIPGEGRPLVTGDGKAREKSTRR